MAVSGRLLSGIAAGLVALAPWSTAAELPRGDAPPAPGSLEEFERACSKRNVPAESVTKRLRFRAVDALGSECLLRTIDMGKRIRERTHGKLCVTEPERLRGSNILGIEASDPERLPDCWFYSRSTRKSRICPRGGGGTFMCTDFTIRELQTMQGIKQPGREERLPDTTYSGRKAYAIAWTPSPELELDYDRVVYLVGKETCVYLQEIFYYQGEVWKVLSANPNRIVEQGGIHVARELLMHNVVAGTYTQAFIDEIELDGRIRDRAVSTIDLAKPCRK